MPLGLRLLSGVRGDWGPDSVPDDVDEKSLAITVSSQPLSVSLSLRRLLPVGSSLGVVGVDLVASPLGMAPGSFPGNVGYLCSAGKVLSLGSPTRDSLFPLTHLSTGSLLKSSRLQESFF